MGAGIVQAMGLSLELGSIFRMPDQSDFAGPFFPIVSIVPHSELQTFV